MLHWLHLTKNVGNTHSRSLVLPWGASPGPLQLQTPWVSGTYQIHLSATTELLCITLQYAVSNESWGSLTNSQYVVFLIAFGPIITSRSNVICLPNINSKGACLIKKWTLLWLWPVLCSTSASRSSSVLPFPLVSPFWTSLEVHLPPYLIYLLPAHIHHSAWILWLELIWSYPSKHWNSYVIFTNVGIVPLSLYTLEF